MSMAKHNKIMIKEKTITFLDLFAGAGGLSEGFETIGYKPIAHVEMNSDACDTLKTRACYYYLKAKGDNKTYTDYLKGIISRETLYNSVPQDLLDSIICETMTEASMPEIFKRIDSSMEKSGCERIDIILGGPPCQAYSMVGRSRKNMDDDPRNTLYKLYFAALKKYLPEMFVFENVPGLITAGNGEYLADIVAGFSGLGYELEYRILNASDFGVLQNRRRIIIIGWRKDTHHFYPELLPEKRQYKVSDILDDLPPLEPGEQKDYYATKDINEYLKHSGIRKEEDVLTWHVARNNLDRDRQIYRLAINTWNVGKGRLKYNDIPKELATHANKTSFLDRFKVVAKDAQASQTMVAHISKDGHYYIHPDIEQARSISVREAARIQSFPDDFYFEGSRTSAFIQIGNAVPPLLSKAIAKGLLVQFGGAKNDN